MRQKTIIRKVNTLAFLEFNTKILELETRSFVVVFVVNLPKLPPIKKYQPISHQIYRIQLKFIFEVTAPYNEHLKIYLKIKLKQNKKTET